MLTDIKQGLAAYQRGETAAACTLFEKSYKLEAATGTLFNLGKCHMTEGHYWQARSEFMKLAREMDHAGKTDKAKIARDQAAAAEAHVPKLVMTFPDGSNVQAIEVDGDDVDAAKWHAAIPVAPGAHVVKFMAKDMTSVTREVDAPDGGASVAVDVPVLLAVSEPRHPSGAAPTGDASTQQQGWSTARTTGVIAGSVAFAAGAAAGIAFTVVAQNDRNQRDALVGGNANLCSGPNKPPNTCDQIASFDHDARVNQTIGIVGFSVAGVAAVGTLVIALWPHSPKDAAFVPILGKHVAGIAASGSF